MVEGTLLGRTKLGAVPYAVEAGRASDSSGLLEKRLAAIEARLGPRSAARAYMKDNQSIPDNADTVVKFNGEDWDDGKEYDPANRYFHRERRRPLFGHLQRCGSRPPGQEPAAGGLPRSR